jgi:hypothetical protein
MHRPRPVPAPNTATKKRSLLPTKAELIVLIPIACVNVGPRLYQLCTGNAEAIGFAFVTLQLLFLYLMSRVLPAVIGWGWDKRSKAFLGFVVAPIIASLFIAVNLVFSNESIGLVWDGAAATAQGKIDTHDRLQSELDTAKGQLAQAQATAAADRTRLQNDLTTTTAQLKALPPYHPTTDAQIASAQNSYDAMKRVQDPDCLPVIGNSTACRKFLNQLNALGTTLNTLRGDQATEESAKDYQAHIADLNTKIAAIEPALQKRSDELNARITGLTDQLTKNGTPPKIADENAHRIAGDLGWTDEQVQQKLPLFISVVAEFAAFIGPYLIAG